MTRDERVGAAALAVVGGITLIAVGAHSGATPAQPPAQTRTVHEVRVLEPTTVYRGTPAPPNPVDREQHRQARRMARWTAKQDPENAGLTVQSVKRQATTAQTTTSTSTTQSPAPASSSSQTSSPA